MSYNDNSALFGDEAFFEEVVDDTSVSTKKSILVLNLILSIRIQFDQLHSFPLFRTILDITMRIIQILQLDTSPETLQQFSWPLSCSFSTIYDLFTFPSPSLPQLRNRPDGGRSYCATLRQLTDCLLQSVTNPWNELWLAIDYPFVPYFSNPIYTWIWSYSAVYWRSWQTYQWSCLHHQDWDGSSVSNPISLYHHSPKLFKS